MKPAGPLSLRDCVELLSRAVEQCETGERAVAQAPPAEELAARLDLALGPEGGTAQALESALQAYLHYNPATWRPDFFKLLYSGHNPPGLLGDWVASLGNATLHTYQVAPVATLMELELIRQLNRLVGFDGGEGVMVSGGSQANLVGMLLARHRLCPDFKTRGADGRRLVAFVSDQAHYSYQRAAIVLGIGTDNLVSVASDDSGAMHAGALERAIRDALAAGETPFFVGLTAGSTVLGAFDAVPACSEVARGHGLWLHIDGAWGGPVLFSDRHRRLLEGSELADSFAWDAHKLMNVPVTAAAILVRHEGALAACCASGGGDYLFHDDENADYNLGERSLQCGRRADALKAWLAWKAIGSRGFADKVDLLMGLRAGCLDKVERHPQLHRLGPAPFLNVLFRYQPEGWRDEAALRELNIGICRSMMRAGGPYVDYAQYRGKTGIRLVLANGELSQSHVDALLDTITRTGRELATQRGADAND